MKSFDQYGTSLADYEGVANVTYREGTEEGRRTIAFGGYFEAKQLATGRIAIGFLPTTINSSGTRGNSRIRRVSVNGDGTNRELSFNGEDADGWHLEMLGQTFYSRHAMIFAPVAPELTEISMSSQLLKAQKTAASDSGYDNARFLVSNLLWHNGPSSGNPDDNPEPIKLKAQGLEITVSPIANFLEVASRLRGIRGIEPTAEIQIVNVNGEHLPLESYKDFITELIFVFKLVTGNGVDWYYGEALDDRTGAPAERIHQFAVNGPYSDTIDFSLLPEGYDTTDWRLNLEGLAQAFLNDVGHVLDIGSTRELINYFVNACDRSIYLEPRGLIASTLTELITAKYAHAKGLAELIEQEVFDEKGLPALREAIKNTQQPKEIPPTTWEELQESASGQVQGAFRKSFRQRLRLLNEHLSLGLDSTQLHQLVGIRNDLVHRGTYSTVYEDGGWLNDYRLAIWVDFMALCRLSGYDGDFPRFRKNRPLQVLA